MGCSQVHFDVAVVDKQVVPVDEPTTVHLTKSTLLHVINPFECEAPICICVERVVRCQKGCSFEVIRHDFDIDVDDPILPPGEYEITIPEFSTPLFETGVVPIDIVFEDVSSEFIQAIIANKSGGC